MTGDTILEDPVGLDTIQLYDRNAEEALLATLIMEPDRITDLDLDPGDLYLNNHKIIYQNHAVNGRCQYCDRQCYSC